MNGSLGMLIEHNNSASEMTTQRHSEMFMSVG